MTTNQYKEELTIAPVTTGWTSSNVSLTIGGSAATYYHQDTASAISVWWGLAEIASNQHNVYIEPYTSTTSSYIIMRSAQAFSINVTASAAATKLGKSGAGSTSATEDGGLYTVKYLSGIQYGFTAAPGAASISGFERGYSQGKVSANGGASVPCLNVPQTLTVRVLTTWSSAYGTMASWETEGYMAWYDVSVGRSWMFRGALEGVSLVPAGMGASNVFLVLTFRAVEI